MDFVTLCAAQGTAGSISDYLNNTTLTASVPTFIAEAEAFVYRSLRHWRMLTPPTSSTMTLGTDQITLPSDFLDPHLFYITASASVTGYGPSPVTLATPEMVVQRYSWDGTGTRYTGTPRLYYFNGSYLQLDTVTDIAYPYSLVYYAQPAALSVSNTTNFLTQYYPRLMRAAIMAHAVEWTKEAGSGTFDRTYWLQIATGELQRAQEESDFAKRSMPWGMVEGNGLAF